MKLNPNNCQLLICGHKYECILTNIEGATVIELYEQKPIGINIGRDLTLENHRIVRAKTYWNIYRQRSNIRKS